MPIEYLIPTYGCKFKCGRKHDKIKEFTEDHEKTCWYNPANKTCKTCKHESYYIDSDASRQWAIRECKINNISEKEYDNLQYTSGAKQFKNDSGNIRPKIDCDKWEQKS